MEGYIISPYYLLSAYNLQIIFVPFFRRSTAHAYKYYGAQALSMNPWHFFKFEDFRRLLRAAERIRGLLILCLGAATASPVCILKLSLLRK
jgi:hypothetical protein